MANPFIDPANPRDHFPDFDRGLRGGPPTPSGGEDDDDAGVKIDWSIDTLGFQISSLSNPELKGGTLIQPNTIGGKINLDFV